ncbi:MAG: hypothetical protein M0Z66_11490 [Thermaerobacter sp.]|nr:hypothetical protein [Thermaerobacter sp.]
MSLATEANWLDEVLSEQHLYQSKTRPAPAGQRVGWRIGVRPYPLNLALRTRLQEIGEDLWALVQAQQSIYLRSLKSRDLAFVAEYLDAGKPEELVRFSQMHRLRSHLPVMMRPDLLQLEGDFVATELDSVPGGFGELSALQDAYSALGQDVLGGPHGVLEGFILAMQELSSKEHPVVGIAVSQESEDYRPEMEHFAKQLTARGERVYAVSPRDVEFREDGLYVQGDRLDVLYRFFELFDLRNVPKADLFLYAQRKGTVVVTPPFKPQLEEKLWFALLHHPGLEEAWQKELGAERLGRLRRLIPQTYILDPRPVPPHAVVAGLQVGGRAIRDLHAVAQMGKRDRADWVLKPSGFSDLAWGSHGVHIGEDEPQEEWAREVGDALADFPHPVWLLQRFHKARIVQVPYYDFGSEETVDMAGRTRLCPYFFRTPDGIRLGGALATVCPADKKIIHGMVDAVMLPASGQD